MTSWCKSLIIYLSNAINLKWQLRPSGIFSRALNYRQVIKAGIETGNKTKLGEAHSKIIDTLQSLCMGSHRVRLGATHLCNSALALEN